VRDRQQRQGNNRKATSNDTKLSRTCTIERCKSFPSPSTCVVDGKKRSFTDVIDKDSPHTNS